jgi:hypothetical protein
MTNSQLRRHCGEVKFCVAPEEKNPQRFQGDGQRGMIRPSAIG